MKIAIWHNLLSGGAKRALYYHVKGLIEHGHHVEAWSPPTADLSYMPLASMIKEHVVPINYRKKTEGGLLSKIKYDHYELSSKFKAMSMHCQKCAMEINGGGFDVLFANTCVDFRVAPIGRYTKIPKLLYLQEPLRSYYEALPRLPWLAPDPPESSFLNAQYFKTRVIDFVKIHYKRILAREELLGAQAYDSILVNSFYSRESLLRAYGINAKVCYLGVDPDLFVPRDLPKRNFVVGLGSIQPIKNIEFVIGALAKVSSPRPQLVWIGNSTSTDYLSKLKRLATSLAVDFVPREMITDNELIDALCSASMMVYAPRLEPFGFAPLEANACCLPVVAVAEGGVRETVVDGVNGLLVEPDEACMARAIELIRDDKSLGTNLGRKGREIVVEKWSLGSAYARLEKRLLEVVSGAERA